MYFYTECLSQRNICTTIFTLIFFCTKNLYTQTAQPKFLHAETLPRTIFTQQKLFGTETFTDSLFFVHCNFYTQTVFYRKKYCTFFFHNIFYRQTFFRHRCICTGKNNLHTEIDTHSTQPVFTQRFLGSPFLITWLCCSPSQMGSLFFLNVKIIKLYVLRWGLNGFQWENDQILFIATGFNGF